jgi:hypothetical protein
MDFGSMSVYVIFGSIIGGFIVVSILMQIIGKNFTWHQELE